MATKAELEAELAELKRQLADREDASEVKEKPTPESEASTDGVAAFSEEIETLIHEFGDELKASPHLKLALGAAGIFLAGVIIGRMR